MNETKITEIPRMVRQGDVLLVPVAEVPAAAKRVKPENGRHVLARGEATGHDHAVLAATADLARVSAEEIYLMVREGEALLQHQEHAPIRLVPGPYRVVRQREFAPESPMRERMVVD